jgi:Mrp family chromosome partitioning ATPase
MTSIARPMSTGGDRRLPIYLGVNEGTRLVHLLRQDRSTGVIVQLIAANSGEGTSSLARDLALLAAQTPNVRVLLLDLAPPGNGHITALRDGFGIEIAVTKPLIAPPAEVLVHQMALGDLHVTETFRPPAAGLSGWISQFEAMRTSYDLILIDSPSAARSYDGIMLSPAVDTTLLVVEAERTRSAAAQNLRDKVTDMGGKIGGVLLNKRRFHIPGFIYRRI